ncbi:hypothetical protein [Cognaticolwellia beringensis]|uniref:Uncharacterized protein n=1 Tax=Cognaticolwellia beringensis TaxID=1967665 RepID=A0A222G467_9GAMM|nr:hypothetical protein [Cognaticolwellia beringensis]ASP46581.1 hypothetical protein B5D82_01565 [Cognaticolwellia beringensis]
MALSAIEIIDNVIDVSEMLLKLLDALNTERERQVAESAEQDDKSSANTTKLLKLMVIREDKIHQLFEGFSSEELQIHHTKLLAISALDNQLVEKVNRTQNSAKSKILTLKKNRKAINLYQKL